MRGDERDTTSRTQSELVRARAYKYFRRSVKWTKNEEKKNIRAEKKNYMMNRSQMLEEKLNFRLLIVLHFAYDDLSSSSIFFHLGYFAATAASRASFRLFINIF